MKKLILRLKIKHELKQFREFKKTFKFDFKKLETSDDGSLFCDGECLRVGENGELVGETESLINVAYNIHGAVSKIYSNLFPYEFYFRGFKLNSIEAMFQGLKFKDKKTQKLVFKYDAFNANRVKACLDYDWRDSQILYFQGKPIKRESKDYEDFVDELYISLLQNPLFRSALKNAGDKYLLHSIGVEDKTQTVLSRFEFEKELNLLKSFVNKK